MKAIPRFRIPFNRMAAGFSLVFAELFAIAFRKRYNGAILI
jgi:hypothetical protein